MPRLISALASLVIFVGPALAAEKLPFPSGRITYKIKAPTMTGVSVVVWADGGKKYRQDMTGTAATDKSRKSAFKISDGVYLFSHESTLGKRVYRRKMPPEAVGQVPFLSVSRANGKPLGKATLLGKPCDIVEIAGKKLWLWKGLPLKMEQRAGRDSMLIEATRLEALVRVSPAVFRVPPGLEVKDAPQPQPKARRSAP